MFLSLLLAAVQVAQPLPPGLLRADANRDGVVTRAEVVAQAEVRFGRFDANRNGRVEPHERGAGRTGRAMTAAEFQQRAQARFARLDTNRDGTLTVEERRKGPRAMRGARGPGGEHRGVHGRAGRHDAVALTAVQFRDRALARFDRVDANRDGRVDTAEITAARAARRG